jgi:hypothetical protein
MNNGEKDIAYFRGAIQSETKEKHEVKKYFFSSKIWDVKFESH